VSRRYLLHPSFAVTPAMKFLSLTYGLFLLSVIGVFWSIGQPKLRIWVLLVASLLFYASHQIQYVPLLLVATWINFQLGRAIGAPPDWRIEDWNYAQQDWSQRRVKLLWFGVGLNLLLLLSFKYTPFAIASVTDLFRLPLPTGVNLKWLSNLAPIGLSFFCFESIAYLVDVYRGAPAAQSLARFGAYKLFFPKLFSGPITRYHLFAGQLQNLQPPRIEQMTEGLWLIAIGAMKKGIFADGLENYVRLSFDNLSRAGSGDIWLATIAYGFQLYLDFSGYVDLARGSAMLLGFNLPQNFDLPYFSTSIAEFWRRWHMTLGDWLRNYLYFPLGGSRQGLVRTCVNLTIVMLLAGLWHGAAWSFVIWGGVHGLALVVHRLTDVVSKKSEKLVKFWASLPGLVTAWLLTQVTVFLSWIIFRLPNLSEVGLAFRKLVGAPTDPQFLQKVYVESLKIYPNQMAGMLLLIAIGMLGSYVIRRGLKLQLNWYLRLVLVPICLYAVWLFAPNGAVGYIYFDF
jgi:alginate O-acetyltransferase complex protein AlgI